MIFIRKDIANLENILAECWLQFYNLDTARLHRIFADAKRMSSPSITLPKEDTKALTQILHTANMVCPWLGVSDILTKVKAEVN